MPFYRFPRVTVHKDYYEREYRAKCLSSGCLLKVAIIVLVVILPFITTYSTGGKLLNKTDRLHSFLAKNRNFDRTANCSIQEQTLCPNALPWWSRLPLCVRIFNSQINPASNLESSCITSRKSITYRHRQRWQSWGVDDHCASARSWFWSLA